MAESQSTPGEITPGKLWTEQRLAIELGKLEGEDLKPSDSRTVKSFCAAAGIKPVKVGKKHWYSTTLIVAAFERYILAEQEGLGE